MGWKTRKWWILKRRWVATDGQGLSKSTSGCRTSRRSYRNTRVCEKGGHPDTDLWDGKKYIQKFEIRFATVRGRRALDMVKVDRESRLGPTPFGTRSGHPNDTFRLATTNVFWEFFSVELLKSLSGGNHSYSVICCSVSKMRICM